MATRFVTSATSVEKLPALELPEVALVGRSNVGKSTLLGRILKQPKLVRTSRTPGRTRLLNLFVFEEQLALVDLPGYGYAKLGRQDRARLDEMVQAYLADRDPLGGVVQVMDARRDPISDYDRFVSSWILDRGRSLLIALTKADLVPKNRRQARARAIETQLSLPRGSALICSGKTGEGRQDLVSRLLELAS